MNAGVLYFQTAYDRMGGRVKHHSGPHFHSQQANAEVKRLLFPSNNVNIISKFLFALMNTLNVFRRQTAHKDNAMLEMTRLFYNTE